MAIERRDIPGTQAVVDAGSRNLHTRSRNRLRRSGTAYASFVIVKGYAAAELRDILNRVIMVIEDIKRKKTYPLTVRGPPR
jgi:hypothetical protein